LALAIPVRFENASIIGKAHHKTTWKQKQAYYPMRGKRNYFTQTFRVMCGIGSSTQ